MLAQLVIGVVVSRRIRTEDDYLVAGRSLGYGLATFTIFATWFGAETCIAAAGSVYEHGLAGGSADPFGYGLCILLMGLVFAVPLWRLRLTTLADLFRRRFSPGVERLAVLLMVPTSLLWAAAQIRGFGQVLSAASGLQIQATITLAAGVVIAYTVSGGLLADAWTDLVQGVALIVGLVVLLAALMGDVGVAPLASIDPERLSLVEGGDASFLVTVERWAIPVVGSVVAAELVARIIATRSPQVARRATLAGGATYLLVGLIPVMVGLMGVSLVPNLAEPEQILPHIAQRYLPTFLFVLFAGALVSAILSTVDSALLVAASLVSHNVVVPLRPHMSERGKVTTARIFVALFGVSAYVMAMRAERVYELVEQASAFGSAGIVVVVVFGLFSRRGGARSAFLALWAGVSAWVLGAYLAPVPYPYLTSLAVAAGAYLLSAFLEPGSAPELLQQTEGAA